ncbi:4Fe-4S dicluster domain-containing protein, partial [Crocinitomicaceae bacterium]|nr:4Fe-4S dicluster domain-containing protein [Crocinitomicaceae bacterium]
MSDFDLWDAHPVEKIGHRWGMTIDLSSCIGCGTCLIACQSENNVPVVGKDEVRRGREMHWLRIDRYFASPQEAAPGQRKDKDTFSFSEAELAAENPMVVHQPMMCHHCNHAPCETVCPVAATTHSNEGLNQMTYNRCIGTRYCANNCPYKVRRFNWFNYPSYKAQVEINPAQDDLGRMVLNPDVTVRTRGVMEKCSMCVQRIQAGKLDAKSEGRAVVDGDYSTACSDVCPTNAITVGDWNDLKSMVRKSADDDRAYQALEEVGVKPNVWFKVKVRNEENKDLDKHQKIELKKEGHGEKKNSQH